MNDGLITSIILSTLASITFASVALPIVIRLCRRFSLYDQPNSRKLHHEAIPRLGGIIFMPSVAVGMFIGNFVLNGNLHTTTTITLSTAMMCIGAFMIYLIGILDDLQGMKAKHKFAIQFAAALLFPLCNLLINDLHGMLGITTIPIYISYPLTVFAILLIVNAMNLIDGIDGLSSGLAFIILVTLGILYIRLQATMFILLSFTLAGAVLIFFIFNFFGKVGKHKTFMGDTGSLFLGYVISYLTIKYQMTNWAVFEYRPESLLISITLVFIPCIDVIRVALFRIYHGKGMFDPDKTHIHHLIMNTGLSMHTTLYIILTLFLIILSTNWALHRCNLHTQYILLIDLLIYAATIATAQLFSQNKEEY